MSGIQSDDTTFRPVVWIGYELIGGLVLFRTTLVRVRLIAGVSHACSTAVTPEARQGNPRSSPAAWAWGANVNFCCKSKFQITVFNSHRTKIVSFKQTNKKSLCQSSLLENPSKYSRSEWHHCVVCWIYTALVRLFLQHHQPSHSPAAQEASSL